MRMNRKGASAIALGLGVAFTAAACGGGAGAADVVPAPAPAVEGGVATPDYVAEASLIGDAQRVGAMADFSFGDTFRATEPITLDLLYRVHPGYPVENDWLIWSAFAENQNVTFNRTDVLMSDWDDRRNILVGAGDFPMLVPVVWPGQQNPWATGGALLPVSDFFAYMPHFMHYVNEWGVASELENQRSADGNIYILPGFRQAPNIEHSFAINQDLFSAAGFGEDWQPATFDELAEALVAVQNATDVQFAFSDRWTDSAPLGAAQNFVGPNFDTQGGWGLSTTRFNFEQDQFIANPLSDGFRDMIGWFAGLMQAGAMDPDITQDDDLAVEKFINGRSAMITSNFQQLNATLRGGAAEAGIALNARMIVVPAGTQNSIAGSLIGPGFVLNANIANDPNFLATLQFLDWILYSEEGREFAQWGVEGVTFGRDAEGNRIYLDDINGNGGAFLNPNFASIEDEALRAEAVAAGRPLNATFGFQDGVWMNTWGGSNDLVQSVMPAEQRAWVAAMADAKDIIPASPAAPLDELTAETVNMINTNINDIVHARVAEFILGTRSMDQWDAFRAEIEGMGIMTSVDALNASLAARRG